MQNIWSKDYTLRANDFDKYDRILPSSVLSLFQDAAGQHGEEIGVGFKEMLERNYLWVVVRLKFKILKAPKRYSKVTIKTWPFEPKRFSYRREYLITDENGEKLMDFVLEIASGKQTKTEEKGFREISIFKDGVVL